MEMFGKYKLPTEIYVDMVHVITNGIINAFSKGEVLNLVLNLSECNSHLITFKRV